MNTSKNLLYLCVLLSLAACARRTAPVKTNTTTVNRVPVAPDRVVETKTVVKAMPSANDIEGNSNVDANIKANASLKPSAAEKAFAVIDSKGNVVANVATLPSEVSHNLDSISLRVRSYTPNQAKNLSMRYNIIPPRVIYVPASLQKQGTRGVYYLYKMSNNTLWYWKKSDGYFYIDENHYE